MVKVPLLAASQLASCASSGRAWRLWAARRSQEEAGPLGAQPLPWMLEPAASKAADFPAFDHAGNAIIKPAPTVADPTAVKKLVEHANFHACKIDTGFCTPLVGKTPGLVTHAPAPQLVHKVARGWPLVPHRRPTLAAPWPTAPCEPCLVALDRGPL